ncbi:MAG TPA: CDP-alcohol phosphatidyltransferase family protein [Thermoclostridium caenicola]|nr:CDP-alcohol phosphatidyltransferase family protein [Thermoclostridium caenicola]
MNRIIKHIPNILTVLRMAAVPVFYVLMRDNLITAATWVFLLAEFTDVLDGIIARKFNLITPFGKIADPVADKMMQLTALFMLSRMDMIPRIIPFLVLFKELFLLISGLYLIRKKFDMSSKWFGKLTSVLFFVAIMMAFLGVPREITDVMLWICVGMAVFASIMYARNYFNQVGKKPFS